MDHGETIKLTRYYIHGLKIRKPWCDQGEVGAVSSGRVSPGRDGPASSQHTCRDLLDNLPSWGHWHWGPQLGTNLREVWSFTITEKAPSKVGWQRFLKPPVPFDLWAGNTISRLILDMGLTQNFKFREVLFAALSGIATTSSSMLPPGSHTQPSPAQPGEDRKCWLQIGGFPSDSLHPPHHRSSPAFFLGWSLILYNGMIVTDRKLLNVQEEKLWRLSKC